MSKQPAEQPRQARGSTGNEAEAGLARQLSELARKMQAEPSMAELLQSITYAALIEIDAAEHAGISLIDGRGVRSEAETDELVSLIDAQQYQLGEGPCLSSLREQSTVRSDDLQDEDRWPRFSAAVAEHGIRSMLSVQLFVDADNLGALNLYSSKPNAFDQHDESAAMLLAAHAAIAIKGSQAETNFYAALQTRDVIGQAKGVLMERFKIGQADAFALLVMASQHSHQKLRDVAEQLATTGELRAH